MWPCAPIALANRQGPQLNFVRVNHGGSTPANLTIAKIGPAGGAKTVEEAQGPKFIVWKGPQISACHGSISHYISHAMPSTPRKKFPTPLGGKPPAERHLQRAPLERVIAQIRFPVILKIEDQSAVSQFQEAIRSDYPVLQEMQTQTVQIQIGPSGPTAFPVTSRNWQFSDTSGTWKITLARDALTIESTSYESRADLLARWGVAISSLDAAFRPTIVQRIGSRYIDRVTGEHFKSFESLINPKLLGSTLADLKAHVKYSLCEASIEIEEGDLLLRWGVMPPMMSPDPSAILQLPHESFILDIDVWSTEQREFDCGDLLAAFHRLAERAYSVFRFAVTEEFLKVYEGKP